MHKTLLRMDNVLCWREAINLAKGTKEPNSESIIVFCRSTRYVLVRGPSIGSLDIR